MSDINRGDHCLVAQRGLQGYYEWREGELHVHFVQSKIYFILVAMQPVERKWSRSCIKQGDLLFVMQRKYHSWDFVIYIGGRYACRSFYC
jgi:hypothetical protein